MKILQLFETNADMLIDLVTRHVRTLKLSKKLLSNVQHYSHKSSKPKQCYNNAFRMISRIHDGQEVKYVLGVILFHGIPMEHAWVKHGEKYFDPTLDPKGNDAYYSMHELPVDGLMAYVEENGSAPDLHDLDRFVRQHPEWNE
jgi:hypothetical protein